MVQCTNSNPQLLPPEKPVEEPLGLSSSVQLAGYNANIANFVLAMSLEIYWTNEVRNLKM